MVKELRYHVKFNSGAFVMADGTVGLPSYSWPTPVTKEKAEARVLTYAVANPGKEKPHLVVVTSSRRR